MIVIYAEKPDMGSKIAAALDKITLKSGTTVSFAQLSKNLKAVKQQQFEDGFLQITFKGQPAYVTWGYGHLCTIKNAVDYDPSYKSWKNLPMPFFPKYGIKIREDTKEQFARIKKLFKKADEIINATDDDREGDVIFSYIYEMTGTKAPYKRSHFADQTYEGIRKAFDTLKPSSESYNSEQAGRARGISDWVVGSNITVAMSLKTGALLKYGRVKTVVETMLVERELARRNFKPETYYMANALFTTDKGEEYIGEYSEKFKNESDVLVLISKLDGKQGVVTNIKSTTSIVEPPKLFSLDTLQMEANSKHGFTLAHTLELAQQLYEKGLTTYPRTTSSYLPKDMETTLEDSIVKLKADSNFTDYINKRNPALIIKKNYYDDSKVESHFAIIPTGALASGLSPDELKLYKLIVYSVIRMGYPNAEIAKTTVTTTVEETPFTTNGSSLKVKGWMEVDYTTTEKLIPSLKKDQIVDGEYKHVAKTTSPPPRYTDKTLLKAMIAAGRKLEDEELRKILENPKVPEASGIGRPSTRAGIVDALIKDGYAERDKKSIYPTEKGIEAIRMFPIQSMKSAIMTAEWETRLNKIEQGTDTLTNFIHDIEEAVKMWVKDIEDSDDVKKTEATSMSKNSTGLACPLCGKEMVSFDWGYGCSGYKEGCKFGVSRTICGKKLTDKQMAQIITEGKTGIIKGFTSKAGKKFDAILKLDGSKIGFEFPEKEVPSTGLTCPLCGKDLVNHSWGVGCSGYKDGCTFSISRTIRDKTLTDKQIAQLVKNGKTELIKGFVSKAGKNFDAYLKLEDGKISFEFPAR